MEKITSDFAGARRKTVHGRVCLTLSQVAGRRVALLCKWPPPEEQSDTFRMFQKNRLVLTLDGSSHLTAYSLLAKTVARVLAVRRSFLSAHMFDNLISYLDAAR
jgi:hypothetical protein